MGEDMGIIQLYNKIIMMEKNMKKKQFLKYQKEEKEQMIIINHFDYFQSIISKSFYSTFFTSGYLQTLL